MSEVQKTKVIRRYQNRKLYDTEECQYTTLRQLVEEIRVGREVMVVDNVSKTDITVKILLNALVETEDSSTIDSGQLLMILRAGGLVKHYTGNQTKV